MTYLKVVFMRNNWRSKVRQAFRQGNDVVVIIDGEGNSHRLHRAVWDQLPSKVK